MDTSVRNQLRDYAVLDCEFIEERVKLIRSLAGKADPFIKPRLIRLAERYEHELWVRRRPAFGRYRGNLNAGSSSPRT